MVLIHRIWEEVVLEGKIERLVLDMLNRRPSVDNHWG